MSDYLLVVVAKPALPTSRISDLRNQVTVLIGPEHVGTIQQQLSSHAFAWRLDETASGATRLYRTLMDTIGADADVSLQPAANAKKKLLVCDMDSTIIGQECLDELADYAGLKPEIAAITERAMRGELDFEDALRERVGRLKGLSADAIDACYRERITLNPGARTLVRTMAEHGARCILVSGGFTAFTGKVADAAGFHAHYANTLVIDGNALTGLVGEPILGREAKLETLTSEAEARGLDAGDAVAIGDGANDLAMINAAGLGVAYRAKPVVAAEADCAINHTSLETALFFQGYTEAEFVRD